MTWKQALLKSIEKWEDYCFTGDTNKSCALCNKVAVDTSTRFETRRKIMACSSCPIGRVGLGCVDRNKEAAIDNLYARTRENSPNGTEDNDYHMLFILYMLYHEYYGDE
jgi:hypothetical protein